MNMQVFNDKQMIEREYTLLLLREFLQRVFKVLKGGDYWNEFIWHAQSARKSELAGEEQQASSDKLIATSIFNTGWRLIAYTLYQCRAPVDINEDLMLVLNEFFTDPDPEQHNVTYGQIAIDAIWEDQSSLESFRHLRHALDCEENIEQLAFEPDIPEEDLIKIQREDMLRSLIKLAMLPSRRFPETPLLRDRQIWVFHEDVKRLIIRYLPESGIKTDAEEITNLVLQIMPRFKSKPYLLALIKNYQSDLKEEIYELIELVEEVVPEPITEVSVSVVVIDGKNHISGIGKQNIEFSPMGILKTLAGLNFSPDAIDDFRQEVTSLLYKIMETLRGPEEKKFNTALSLLGDFRSYLYEIKKKLSKFHGADASKLKPAELKQKCIIDSLQPIEAEISEIMPMSLSNKRFDGIRIQDPSKTG